MARAAVFVPTLEAGATIEAVLRGITAVVRHPLEEILVQDDGSSDETLSIARRLAETDPVIRVVVNDRRLGYGGTCKKGFEDLAARGMEVIVMVHGDGQHDPSHIDDLLEPLVTEQADVVLGSRMQRGALRGGMPLYKWLANKVLTSAMNRVLAWQLTDYHTGFVALTGDAVRALELSTCSDGHEISAEMLLRAKATGCRVAEVAVSTSYGDGSRSVSATTSLLYGLRVLRMLHIDPGKALEVR